MLKQNELFSLLIRSLPQKPRIIEAGAFIGNHTIKFMTHFPDATIYSFEPVPQIYKELCYRTKQYNNVHCYQQAISNKNGETTLFIAHNPQKPEKLSSASSLHEAKNRRHFSPIVYPHQIQVNTITLDSWFNTHQIDLPIDLLWIDTQGHEYYVLEGAKELLKSVRFIHVEVHFGNPYEKQKEYQEVLGLLEKQGFIEIARDFNETSTWFFGNVLLKNQVFNK